MKDEIKEILDYLKPKYDIVDELGNDYKKVKFKDCKLLLDYITNLQEELTDTEKEWTYWEDRCDKAEERLNKLIDNLELKEGK